MTSKPLPEEREVAGLRCKTVLRQLSSYLDGEADAALSAQIEAHLAGCDWCQRFGGAFAEVVTSLRASLAAPERVSDAVASRLAARLAQQQLTR